MVEMLRRFCRSPEGMVASALTAGRPLQHSPPTGNTAPKMDSRQSFGGLAQTFRVHRRGSEFMFAYMMNPGRNKFLLSISIGCKLLQAVTLILATATTNSYHNKSGCKMLSSQQDINPRLRRSRPTTFRYPSTCLQKNKT